MCVVHSTTVCDASTAQVPSCVPRHPAAISPARLANLLCTPGLHSSTQPPLRHLRPAPLPLTARPPNVGAPATGATSEGTWSNISANPRNHYVIAHAFCASPCSAHITCALRCPAFAGQSPSPTRAVPHNAHAREPMPWHDRYTNLVRSDDLPGACMHSPTTQHTSAVCVCLDRTIGPPAPTGSPSLAPYQHRLASVCVTRYQTALLPIAMVELNPRDLHMCRR